MRIAFHSPLPPERSGIADYSYELLEELRHRLDVVAVVADGLAGVDRAPEGVEVVGASSIEPGEVDCDVYQMGNNPRYHRFLFQRALDHPGLLVLHDPSLADFHAEMCRSPDSAVFRDEIAYDNPALGRADPLPIVDIGRGGRDLDRLEVLLARRMVEASIRTLVHSSAVAAAMRRRYEGCDVATIQLPAPVVAEPGDLRRGRRPGEVVFGVFGGINYYKRIDAVVEAFRRIHGEHPLARLVIAGRPDDREMTARLRRLAADPGLGGCLEVKTELSLAQLEAEMTACDVAVSLRWPTAGEMSATLMRAFGAGRPAVVTDVLQFQELDERFCWRVPVGDEEIPRLVQVLRTAASDPAACAEAGGLARAFVEREATYEVVSEQYVAHIEHCASRRAAKAAAVAPLGLAANAVLGVNLVEAYPLGSDGGDAAAAVAAALRGAEVDVVSGGPGGPGGPAGPDLVERLPPERILQGKRSLKAARTAARRGRRPAGGPDQDRSGGAPAGGPGKRAFALQGRAASTSVAVGDLHDIDLCHADPRRAAVLGRLLRDHHRRGRRTVAVLSPDALPVARSFERVLRHADEVWVPSAFAADLLAGTPLAPVVVVPVPLSAIAAPDAGAPRRAGGGAGPFRVLAVADGSGGIARANPEAAVAAFEAAFSATGPGAQLELVVRHLPTSPEARARLDDALGRVGGRLVEEDDPAAIAARVASCDVLVSLHRTQSFGLWCARAMAAGKPVVATAYGGCLDYTSPSSACLVGYELVELSEGDFYLDEPGEWGVEVGQRWASPDVDQAAAWLRRLAAHETLRARIGDAARRAVAAHCDEAAIGRLMRARLEGLAHRSPSDERRRRRREARLAWDSATGVAPAAGGQR